MGSEDLKGIRCRIEQYFSKILKAREVMVKGIVNNDAYGHSAGTPMEDWVREHLEKVGVEVYYPNVFLDKLFRKIGKDKQAITDYLNGVWWGNLLATPKQIISFLNDNSIGRWQQEGADLVVVRDHKIFDNLNMGDKVILVNVKSHESTRKSRPPNIMSAQRLLEFLYSICSRKDSLRILEDVNLWFIGVKYTAGSSGGIVESISLKELFKLDVSLIPQINFDAAIQIQWHVEDMVEKDQKRVYFIRDLSDMFIKQWRLHSKHKTKKYETLVRKIKIGLRSF